MVQRDHKTLTDKVGQLESELKSMKEECESVRSWRENVLKGSPVLFEDSGLVFTLQPYGKLASTDGVTLEPSASALIQNQQEPGDFPLRT